MLNKPGKRSVNFSVPESQPIIPDPWETGESESHFPSPLELDRLLSEPHPLIQASEPHPEIKPAGQVGVELLAAPSNRAEPSLVSMLLQNELKLHTKLLDHLSLQIEKALALLYWLATEPEQSVACNH
jgi:hypothetical protein